MNFVNLKNCMDKFVSEYGTPGVDVIVCRDHKVLYRYFAGFSDIENGKEVTGDELYFIFSMTKMLTCCCALQLLEQGKYSLDDEISKYLPEYKKIKITSDALNTENALNIASGQSMGESADANQDGYAKTPITVRHLFTMTAGLDYDLNSKGIKVAKEQGKTSTRELVAAMADKTFGFEPGTRFRYSLCHDVLGALVEIWSGKSLGEYMKENIFEPIGMKNTFFGLPDDISRMAPLYRLDADNILQKQPLKCPYNLSDDYQSGGAGLTSCCEDYAMFLDTIACGGITANGNRILKEDTVNLWKTNQLSGRSQEDFYQIRKGYGYGLGVRTHIDPTQSGNISPVGEFGWDGAAGAFSMVDCDNKISLTYFQSLFSWDVGIQTEMRNALYKDLDD